MLATALRDQLVSGASRRYRLQRFLQVSVNQRDRTIAQQKLNELLAPRPAPPPPSSDTTTAQRDTVVIPTDPDEPTDTIRILPPR